ncbi:MAG: Single-stranded-DNA-specific exonuclease RecJ [Planctomycetota bacterium]
MVRAALKVPNDDPRERALARTLGMPDLVARTLLARGLDDPTRVRAHLRPDLRTLADPFRFTQMRKAVDRIRLALRNRETIVVHGDYDVDGISGTVLLHRFFRLLHADVRAFIPARSDGYSFSAASLQAVRESGAKLVISVDNGTNAVEWIRRIQEAGTDVVVTDHHGTSDNVAEPYALLNPRLPDAGYPDVNLAGVGVAFRLAAAVAESMTGDFRRSPEFAEFLADAMGWVALGTVADVAPLDGENRVMVWHGLRMLAQSRNPGIRALLDCAGIANRNPGVEDIAFRMAPLLNAAGRMGNARESVELLLAPGYVEAQAAAKVLERRNEDRRRVERTLQEQVLQLSRDCADPAIVLGSEDWHAGVIGIVAARVAEQTGKPAILVAFKGGIGRGSGRCNNGLHLREALKACSMHLNSHGGHAAAAGLEVRAEHFEAFRARFHEVCRSMPHGTGDVEADGHARFAELDPETLRRLDLLGPFGSGNPRPRFCTPNVKLVGQLTTETRGLDLRTRVSDGSTVLPARIVRAHARFEELRSRPGPWTIVWSPRLNSRGEEGPILIEVHHLVEEVSSLAGANAS